MKTTYLPALVRQSIRNGLVVVLGIFLGVFIPNRLPAQSTPSLEYKVKAVFLYNFTQFVMWPESSFATDDAPFVIGVLGENPFGTYLKETVSGEKKENHPITVQYYKDVKDIKPCHILYVPSGQEQPLQEVLTAVQKRAVLTVGDAPDFITKGGIIRFYTLSGKIRLQIQPETAKAAGLTISSKLLRLAELVQ
ncbi:YfiR family protein [Telluribacter sp. SYSU D00476]|uniref:YfiR family protein n=1 Tax=Telluribacter sp. SYSU D00476 TaxID=2811430 RepID=UPI001FF0EC1F|nr:YfiR family protein [Telluribacter sp. SYSU D00476]